MRQSVRNFVEVVHAAVGLEGPFLEMGSLQLHGQEAMADLRPLFPEKEYVGGDMRMGRGVDRILNLEHLELEDETFGTILILETLEHVAHPLVGMKEAYRVLKSKGIVVLSMPMDFPIHHEPNDYYRYTPQGLAVLLEEFDHIVVADAGCPVFPSVVVGVGVKGEMEPLLLENLCRDLEAWSKRWPREPGLKAWLRQFASPAALDLYRYIRGFRRPASRIHYQSKSSDLESHGRS